MSLRFATFIKNGGTVTRAMSNKRLLKLADHLEFGKRFHENFDFSVISEGPRTNVCGTNGCAMGELPFLFSRDWRWGNEGEGDGNAYPVLRGLKWNRTLDHTALYFGLTSNETLALFVPYRHQPWNGDALESFAGPETVAREIRNFVKWRT